MHYIQYNRLTFDVILLNAFNSRPTTTKLLNCRAIATSSIMTANINTMKTPELRSNNSNTEAS